ncbi:MAG: hypothetical protein E7431_04105 [Ruminococcaceae bacterium]|nr:hypothetical protein [Oscillospiraceae bacterium]
MKEQLIQYVNLLFAGAPDSEDIKQEILQNTLDRFDDLIAQGKSPEAAYRLAITGIGDINEILSAAPGKAAAPVQTEVRPAQPETEEDLKRKKIRAVAVAMYILCAVPLIILSEFGAEILGLCLTLAIVAFATYLMIITGRKDDDEDEEKETREEKHPLKESIGNIIWVGGLIVYFGLSFYTGAWHITWLLFPIMACARGLSDAIIDLMEVKNNEN